MRQPKFSFIDHRAAGWYYPWVMEGRVPTSSPLETKMRIAKQAGFDGVGTSWWDLVSFYQERGALSQLKTLTQQLHLPLTGCTFVAEGWAFASGSARQNALSLAKSSLNLAHAAGCQNASIVGSFETGELRQAAQGYRELCQHADSLGIPLGLEFIGPAPQLKSLAVAREVVELAGAANGGVTIDSYHFYAGSSNLKDLEEFPLDKIIAVHLADAPADLSDPTIDFNRIMPGEGELPLKEFIQVLDAKGFGGFWHAECIQGKDYASDLKAVTERAFRLTERVVRSALSSS